MIIVMKDKILIVEYLIVGHVGFMVVQTSPESVQIMNILRVENAWHKRTKCVRFTRHFVCHLVWSGDLISRAYAEATVILFIYSEKVHKRS